MPVVTPPFLNQLVVHFEDDSVVIIKKTPVRNGEHFERHLADNNGNVLIFSPDGCETDAAGTSWFLILGYKTQGNVKMIAKNKHELDQAMTYLANDRFGLTKFEVS